MLKRCLKAPTLSIEDSQLYLLPYPVLGSPKIDGFRCLIDGTPRTSSMKPQPNPYVFETLSDPKLNGLDGELVLGEPNDKDAFNKSTGPLRRKYGQPDFTFYTFDNFLNPNQPYAQRWLLADKKDYLLPRVVILPQTPLYDKEEVIEYTNQCVADNYEGAMIRSLKSTYKAGRATFKEMNIFKRKPLTDAEAVIIGFNEKMINFNPQVEDEMGLMKRASNKDLKVGAGTLGSFILQCPFWNKPFNCTGKLNDSEKLDIWNNQEEFLGKIVTFKYQQYGSIAAPRQPIFRRFYKEL